MSIEDSDPDAAATDSYLIPFNKFTNIRKLAHRYPMIRAIKTEYTMHGMEAF